MRTLRYVSRLLVMEKTQVAGYVNHSTDVQP